MSSSVTSTRAWYTEWAAAPPLRDRLACLWAAQYGAAGERHVERVIPDGCIDLLFSGGELVLAGPDTQSVELPSGENLSFVGVRFRAGVAPAALGVPASAILDQRVPARDVLGADATRLRDELALAATPREAAKSLEAAATRWLRHRAPDPLVLAAISRLERRADWTVAGLAEALGVSERQLRRRFVEAVGYGPKLLERVLRLRRFIGAADAGATGLARLALDAGYADQPHLTRECQELTGMTPGRLLGYPLTSV